MSEVSLPGFADETQQWRARCMQVVNWGGFHGYKRIDLAEGTTLISGGSGTGKSTLLDAYTALMMPSSVPFNGASNNATVGRARDASQRNVLTYLKGKRDTADDGTDQVLRGDDTAVWGALAMTFQDDLGRRFTPLRTYYVPVGATHTSEVAMKLFTIPGDLDLSELEHVAPHRFDPRVMRTHFPAIIHHDTLTRFFDAVTSRLGIGSSGEGERALRLLARIQAGHQVKTVDRLYKELVLERPRTYDAAERVLEQFASLDQSYRDLETDAEKRRILDPVPGLHVEYLRARGRVERLDRYGVTRSGSTPFQLWQLRAEERLLRTAEDHNRQQRRDAAATVDAAREALAEADKEVREVERQLRDNGGGALEVLAADIERRRAELSRVTREREEFLARIEVLAVDDLDEQGFGRLQQQAHTFLGEVEELRGEVTADRDRLVESRPALDAEIERLGQEVESLGRRDGLVPMEHDRARTLIAEACGMGPEELPFVAELMDLKPEFEQWRGAAEATLRGVGLTMLMDQRRQAEVRQRIDSLELGRRISFEGVEPGLPLSDEVDERYLSGRLRFRTGSPFAGWVQARVSRPGFDHLCVDSPEQLGGDEPKVTIQGQTSAGRRGAHGVNRNQRPVLGFSSAARVAELQEELRVLVLRRTRLAEELTQLQEREAMLRRQEVAHRGVVTTTWASIDVVAVQDALSGLEARCDALVENSDVLTELKASLDALEARREELRAEYHQARLLAEGFRAEHGEIVERQDAVVDERDALEAAGVVELPADDEAQLDAALAEVRPEVTWQGFRDATRELARRLRTEAATEQDRAEALRAQLEGIFERFNDRWPDPNRGTGVAAHPEYAEILEGIIHHGLSERREVFRQYFQQWSGNDLKLLGDAFEEALEDIQDRLDPVNDILQDLPFGAGGDRLRITVRQLHPQALTVFRRELRQLSSTVGGDWDDEQTDERFARLRSFVTSLAEVDGSSARDDLLDVRRHIEVTASKVDAEGRVLSTYASLGGKSGGESQELVSFIVGAALRYQLGDETRTKPRFAPVLLDEGFIKADGEFAFRAVRAWRGLGFQLIIGAPLDKVTALEPHCDLILAVTKNDATGYSYVQPLQEIEEEQVQIAES
ncbi:MAG: ATP-binding protein [Arachnia propionica]|uniref:ATP-binding protein n=1 Tax=Arachnia propionica TaxID=1750 RepID=UPI0026F6EE73|nr:ATP-binding protein [Arachnia propionica]